MDHVRELGQVLARKLVVVPGVERAGVGHDQVRFPTADRAQCLEYAHAVDRAGRAGHGDDQALPALAGNRLHAFSTSFFQRNRWFSSGRRMPNSIAAIITTSVMVQANTWSVCTRSAA